MNTTANPFKGVSKDDFLNAIAPLRKEYHKAIEEKKFMGRLNDYLRQAYAELEGTDEFNSFKGWKDKGFKVKKGEKAYRVYSAPKKSSMKVEIQDMDTGKREEKEFSKTRYFQACIFSRNQVEPIAA